MNKMSDPLCPVPQVPEHGLDKPDFKRDLAAVLNKHSVENHSNTPDFILADYLIDCLKTYGEAVRFREKWHGRGEDS